MDPTFAPRLPSPVRAVALGLLCTGLGQMYCGRYRRGLVFFLLAILFGPNLLWLLAQPPSGPTVTAMIVSVALAGLLLVASAVDAGGLAVRLRRDGEVAPPLGVALGALCVVVGVVTPTATAMVIRATTVEAFAIAGSSMAPGLAPGDRVLVDKVGLRYGLPARGEVVVFRAPGDGRNFIKRVIGLEGDRVEIRGGEVRVNDTLLPRTPAPEAPPQTEIERSGERTYPIHGAPPAERGKDGAWTVPPGHVFLLGDNRAATLDSRQFGPVPRSGIIGVASCVFWPLSRLGDPVR
ncbi:MAG TPA: signal peptidase I [Planctomycetota bacterium]|nr:signal peptidase I [Planctomycetota bacterium]